MRILYLSQYFFPETGATQIRAYEMAHNWVQLGHQVTIIAEVPNHPSGIIPPEYRGKYFQRDNLDGIEIIRVWVKASPQKNFRNRMLFYISFMINAILAGLFLARNHYDLIYASSPPLFVGGAALAISSLRRLPMVFEVRDLWPEMAVSLGELTGRRAIRWATTLEEACYRQAAKIIVVTQGIRERLVQRGISADKMECIPNGSNTDFFQFNPAARDQLRHQLGLEGKFIAMYAGIHGIAQGLESVVEAAKLLQDDPDFHFLFVGEGPKRAELAALATRLELNNLTLLPEQPLHAMPAYLSTADVALVPLRNIDIFKGTLPSKMFDAWSCNRPLLLSVDGEARQVMDRAHAGIFVPPEDPQAMVTALVALKNSPDLRLEMGRNGREYTLKNFSRQAQAHRLAIILESKFS
jgi:glycosyltransferase involved in cell wall biosynthesis